MGRKRRGQWIALSTLIVTVVAAVDALIGGDLILIALLSAGPLVASTRLSPRTTAAISLYAVALTWCWGSRSTRRAARTT